VFPASKLSTLCPYEGKGNAFPGFPTQLLREALQMWGASRQLPKFTSLDQSVEFFDTHDMGDYWDDMPEVHFDIDIKRRTQLFALDEDLAERVTAMARAKQIPSGTLINEWLREKIQEQTKTTP
jgi:hypothetical protein